MRAACCKRWFDCTQCHEENSDHQLFKTMELIVACKACKKVFKKDLQYSSMQILVTKCLPIICCRIELEESDEFCPYCDNHFVVEVSEANVPQPVITLEGDDSRMIRDHRMKQRTIPDEDLALLEAL